MNCNECRPLLDAYVDAELDARSALEIDAHLAACAPCTSRLRALRQVSQAVRVHASRFAPSRGFESRLRASLRSGAASAAVDTTARAPRARRIWFAVPLAAAIVLAWFGGAWWSRPSAEETLAGEVVAAHVRSLLGDHLTDVESSDRHTVNPWFQGKIPFAVGARDFSARGFPLAGGRLDYIGGRTVAAIVYRHGPHAINVFVWPSTADGELSVEPFTERSKARGYTSSRWVQDGLTHWAVSDVDDRALAELVDLLRAEK